MQRREGEGDARPNQRTTRNKAIHTGELNYRHALGGRQQRRLRGCTPPGLGLTRRPPCRPAPICRSPA
eukprot:1902125-Pyramimonas_sp.AAC.1